MAHIGDEIAAGGFHPGLFGIVVGEQNGEAGCFRGQRPGQSAHRDPAPARCGFVRGEIEFRRFGGGQYLLHRFPGAFVEQPVAHQAELLGARIDEHDIAIFVHDRDTAFRGEHDQVENLGHGETGVGLAALRRPGVNIRDHQSTDGKSDDSRQDCQQYGLGNAHIKNRTVDDA